MVEQALETAALMLGTDKSRGYCLGGYGQKHARRGLSNIFDKLGVSTRLELALFAVNQRLPLKRIP